MRKYISYGCVAGVMLGLLLMPAVSLATTVTSSFNNWVYSYTVTPAPGEVVKDFHVAAGYDECDVTHYHSVVMPAGWNFTVHHVGNTCWISWWTEGEPLPVGVASSFGYTHYCAPCCHTWVVTNSGTDDPGFGQFDGSYNHLDEPCNIPAEFYPCPENDGGLVVAPIYPTPTVIEGSTWGLIKALYK